MLRFSYYYSLFSLVRTLLRSAALHALTLHSQEASRKGWCLPELVEFPCPAIAPPGGIGASSPSNAESHQPHGATAEELQPIYNAIKTSGANSNGHCEEVPRPLPLLIAEGLVPYWLSLNSGSSSSNRGSGSSGGGTSGVGNDLTLSAGELVLLTAPNMSGKSTLMRSLLSASLLANCGLRVPAHHFQAPRFDAFFLRAAGGDSPAEVCSLCSLLLVILVLHFSYYCIYYWGFNDIHATIHHCFYDVVYSWCPFICQSSFLLRMFLLYFASLSSSFSPSGQIRLGA